MRVAFPAAMAIIFAGSGWSAPAAASGWGCQVLLCLSNPGGPTQYAACVPPVSKLWDQLATGHPFPSCTEGGVAATKTHGRRVSSGYRVTMTYSDGSQQTYSLAGTSNGVLLADPAGPLSAGDLP